MTSSHHCPQCGAALPADAPEHLCPACLMSAAVLAQSDPGATVLIEKPKPRDLPHVGEIFGGYRIERELGRGGMGAVFAVEHLESGRRVALKVLSHKLDSPDARARFLREGRLAASINHPNSVYVFGTEEIEGTPVIAMELIAGGTLQERVQRSGPLPVGEAVDAVLQIIAGLEAAQAIGILHRDIKPANCFEDADGTVKVGDFGLSISTQGRGESHLTLPGDFLGTPAFCPPEQLRGDELNLRSDMYSVGVTLFYLLTGRTPFEGKNMVQLLANALEKSPPSPTHFRPEIPSSLSRVVLRCLEKLPASRFGSYEELRRALQPFTSTAPTPATLGLRFVAMIADSIILSVINGIVMALCYGGFTEFLDPMRFVHSPDWRWLALGLLGLQLAYWGILEGVWGASVGKALVGLRVARVNRSAPGIPRALARHLILSGVTMLTQVIYNAFYFNGYDPAYRGTQWASFAVIGLWAAYTLGMFATARRRNGFAAVHDLLTGTRVIQKSAYQPRTILAQPETPVAATESMPKLGPYHLLATLSTDDAETLSLGYDTRLLRKVWIRQAAPGEPQVPPALRNIARPGRLRWLQGGRTVDGSWDAYEAVSGAPLVDLIQKCQPWQSVRHWLQDLAAELESSAKNSAAPPLAALDRVWITADGRAKLLAFRAPGAAHRNPAAAAAVSGGVFLNQVAISALEGRIAGAEEAATRVVSAPLPLGAREVLRDLVEPSSGQSFAEKLKPLLQEPPCVAWWKRCAMVLICAAPGVMMSAMFGLGALMLKQWRTQQPELMPLMTCLLAHKDMERGNPSASPKTSPTPAERRAAMEVHIAGRYGDFIRDEKSWSSPLVKLAIQPDLRATAERLVAAHPHTTEEDIQKADAVIKPMIDAFEHPSASDAKLMDLPSMMKALSHIMVNWTLTLFASVSLVCALVLRRGPLFRVLGISVVTRQGTEASRLRMMGRALIAWSPVLLSAVMIKISDPFVFETSLPLFATQVALIILLAIISLAQRERGLQDKLAGTWLVPA